MKHVARSELERSYRIFVVDDFPVVRRGVVDLINSEPDFEVCGEAGDAAAALVGVEATRPNAVVADLSLGEGPTGLELIKAVRSRFPDTIVVVLSMMDESVYAGRCLRAGARGFIPKESEPQRIVSQIRTALGGGVAVSERATQQIIQTVARSKTGDGLALDALTDRQLEVFRLVGQGLGTRDIATQLHVSTKTVESHRESIRTRLDLADGGALLRAAISWAHRLHS